MPVRSHSLTTITVPLAGAAVLLSHSVLGEGFRNSPAGGFSLARAGGRIAQIDSPAAVQHNPANVVRLADPAVEVAPTFVYIHTEHNNASGQAAETTEPWKVVPAIFAAFPLHEKVALGLGVTAPFGLANEWEESGAFGPGGSLRYVAPHFAEMVTLNFNPTISARVCSTVTIGAGLDIYTSRLRLRQYYPWAPFGAPGESEINAEGDGVGFGGNFGITWEPRAGHRIAATYRSPVTVEYEGDTQIDNMPAAPRGFGASGSSIFETEIEFPTIIAVGYGIDLTEKARLEVNVEYLEFSNFKSLDLNVGANNVLFGGAPSFNQDWRDTYTIGIAGDYEVCEGWRAMGGYQFYKSPVPDHTFSTTIPDADQHALTGGLMYSGGHHRAELGYSYVIYEDRDIRGNGAFNGSYETTVHLITASYIYSF